MSLDDRTGLLLEDVGVGGHLLATSINLHPRIDVDTFSTTIPPGQGDANRPPMQDFSLPRVGGGKVALSDRQGRPLIIVTGDAPSIRKVMARLLPLTAGGRSPRVIGLLVGGLRPGWKGLLLNPRDEASLDRQISAAVGSFTVPVGIDVKGGVGHQINNGGDAGGVPIFRAGIGLVASDGTLVHSAAIADVDDAQLRTWVSELS